MHPAEATALKLPLPRPESRRERMHEHSNTDRQVEAVVIRNPDGPVDLHIFIDGLETPITEFLIDAGAGWHWADWKYCRDRNLSAASPSARLAMLAAYADPPGGRYVRDRGEAHWLDNIPKTSIADEDQR